MGSKQGVHVAPTPTRVQQTRPMLNPQVEEFMLWDLPKVAHVIAHTDDYKPNCGVVVMDFLVSHRRHRVGHRAGHRASHRRVTGWAAGAPERQDKGATRAPVH